MNVDYSKYKADQLLNDNYFIHSELSSDQADIDFWSNLENENSTLAEEIKLARDLLKNIRDITDSEILSPEAEQELWKQISFKNHRYDIRFKRNINVAISIAASVAFLIGIAWYSNRSDTVEPDTDYVSMLENTKQPDISSGDVQLILSNNETIALDGKETHVKYQKDGTLNINTEEDKKLNTPDISDQKTIFNQLIVPIGKRSTITFQDGTKLWVNSGSTVIYPVYFDKNKREIFAEGEIFLDVVPDSERPFVVKTKQLDVSVLGTQFNLSAYKSEKHVQVVLVSGKVEVETQKKEKHILTPNQLYSYHTETYENNITQVNVNEYIAWKDGYYQFSEQKMDIVFRKISQFYQTDIQWNPQLNKLSCSGKLDMKDDIGEVLKALQKAAPIIITQSEENVYIDVKPLN